MYVKHDLNEMFSQTPPLIDKIELKIDGVHIKLEKKFRCLQVLNLNSMSDGIDFFGVGKSTDSDLLLEGQYTPQRINDGKAEVVTESSVHHYNMCFLGLARGRRIGQGSRIEITLKESLPMEVDGEPFTCPRGFVRVSSFQRQVVYGYKTNVKTKRLFE